VQAADPVVVEADGLVDLVTDGLTEGLVVRVGLTDGDALVLPPSAWSTEVNAGFAL